MKNKKIISIILIIVVALIIATAIALHFVNTGSDEENTITDNTYDMERNETELGIGEFPEEKVNEITEAEWLQLRQCANEYFSVINKNNSAYFGRDADNNYVKVIDDNTIKNNIYSLLSKNYITENGITIDNVYDFVDDINSMQTYYVLNVTKYVNTNTNQYVVDGFLTQDNNNTFNGEKILIINFDPANELYSIEPVNDVQNIDEVEPVDVTIDKADNNEIPSVLANQESMAIELFNTWKAMELAYPEKAYDYLDDNYREKRFGDLEGFETYIDTQRDDISKLSAAKYLVNDEGDYTQYVCQDRYQNLYIFNINDLGDYTVELDTYTVPTDTFINEYNSSNDENRVMLQIDVFRQMINNYDFEAAYNLLDSQFKQSNFSTEEEFENYVREHTFRYNAVDFGEIDKAGDVYTCKAIFTDLSEGTYEDETKNGVTQYEWNFVIKLEDAENFVLSFDISQ